MTLYRLAALDGALNQMGEYEVSGLLIDKAIVARVTVEVSPEELDHVRERLCTAFPDRPIVVLSHNIEFLEVKEVIE